MLQVNRELFWSKVNQLTEPNLCWEWTGTVHHQWGYGQFTVGSRTDGSRRKAQSHRLAWELTYGPIPDGMVVMHECDNPRCCNINHLRLGTHQENMADRDAKGRQGDHSGQNNGRSKLTWADVDDIRCMYSQGGTSSRTLAERFGVTKPIILGIAKGTLWKLEHRPSCDDCGRWLNSDRVCPVCSVFTGSVALS